MTFAIALLIAGNVTTTDLIGNAVLALLQHPGELSKLLANPNLVRSTVEEVLRYDTPVVQGTRIATEAMQIGGCPVAAGQTINAVLYAANHDPEAHPDPKRFDIERPDKRHNSFGGGAHFCLGAPLARAEAQIALSMLFERFPNAAPENRAPLGAPDDVELQWTRSALGACGLALRSSHHDPLSPTADLMALASPISSSADRRISPNMLTPDLFELGIADHERTILRSGIDRRTLLTTLALLPALSAPPLSVSASAQTASSGPLPSWNEGSAKQAILDFVRDTTDRASPKFVPPGGTHCHF